MAKAKRVHSTPRKTTSANSDAARLAALSRNDCPVRAIMQQFIAIRKVWSEFEDKADPPDRDKELWDTTEILLNMASITRAQSLQGALFQLAVLKETLHVDLFQNIPKEIQDQVLDREQKAVRLLHSAASVIEKIIGEEAAAEAKGLWLQEDGLSHIEGITNGIIGRCAA
jgi:hypothetical protein